MVAATSSGTSTGGLPGSVVGICGRFEDRLAHVDPHLPHLAVDGFDFESQARRGPFRLSASALRRCRGRRHTWPRSGCRCRTFPTSLPSALNIRIRASARSDGPDEDSPSEPTPKCRSLIARLSAAGSAAAVVEAVDVDVIVAGACILVKRMLRAPSLARLLQDFHAVRIVNHLKSLAAFHQVNPHHVLPFNVEPMPITRRGMLWSAAW